MRKKALGFLAVAVMAVGLTACGGNTHKAETSTQTVATTQVEAAKEVTKPVTKKETTTEFDPDDHDIEAYYDDNRDEYDSYEDAYEGFLDDESSWDDY